VCIERLWWGAVEFGKTGRFWVWVYSSRVLVIASSVFLILGLFSIPLGLVWEHVILMLLGIRLFYSGVMWAQVPGYAGYYMPHPLLSISIAVLEISGGVLAILGSWLWVYVIALSGFIHASVYLYRRAIGSSPLKLPNILTLAGLLHSSLSLAAGLGPLYSISFPLLSACSLMVRVEPNINGYRISRPLLYTYIALSIASLALSPLIGVRSLVLIAGLVVIPLYKIKIGGVSLKLRVEDIYRLGSSIAKILGVLSMIVVLLGIRGVDYIHMSMIGFLAVIMASLCTPLLLPGIMGRAYRAKWVPIQSIVAIIGIARAIPTRSAEYWGWVELLALVTAALIMYIIYITLSSEKAL
jgi:hypothetical protein